MAAAVAARTNESIASFLRIECLSFRKGALSQAAPGFHSILSIFPRIARAIRSGSPTVRFDGSASIPDNHGMATEPGVTTVRTEVPSRLLTEVQALVEAGWFRSVDEVILDALRRFLDSHREDLMAELIHEDVRWGLQGKA
jgi:hypothetical protein